MKFWTKWDFSGVKSRKEHSSINLNLGDCQQNSLGLISTTGYTVDGSVTWSQSFPEYAVAMDPAIPESIGDLMLNKACAIAAGTDKGF